MKPQVAALAAVITTACVPAGSNYYKPSASGGNAVNDHCGSFIAPRSSMRFEPEGIDTRIESSGRHLRWQFRVPEGTTVKLMEPQIRVVDSQSEFQVTLEGFQYTNIDEKKSESIAAVEPLIGKNETFLFGNVEPRIFSAIADFPQEMGESFSVLLPTVRINGKVHQFPAVNFSKGKGFGLYPVNC